MICDIRYNSLKRADRPLNVRIVTRVVGGLCANACFHKFAFCDRRFQDWTKAACNCCAGRNGD